MISYLWFAAVLFVLGLEACRSHIERTKAMAKTLP